MEVTYFGHSCFLVTIGNKKLLFDPFITPNKLAEDIGVSEIKPDYILLSHGHQDHVADVEQIQKQSGAKVISTFEVIQWFGNRDIENTHPMNHGGSWEFDFGVLKMVNAVHSSSMPDGSYGGHPAGFVIASEETTFYYAGDTALHYDMQLIPEEFKIDVAFLPIGSNFTMDVDDALRAAKFVQTEKVIGMHYDTFPFIEINHEEALQAAEQSKIELHLMKIGETKNF